MYCKVVLQDKIIIIRKYIQWNRQRVPLQTKQQAAVQYPEKDYFSISNRQISKRITAYVWHTKNESMKNVIVYVALRNKTMAHSMSLINRISCVVGISIFGFKTYWKQVFNLMEIHTTQTFKQLLQAKTFNAKKNKSYYQQLFGCR